MFAKEEWGLRPKEFANLIGKFDSGPGYGHLLSRGGHLYLSNLRGNEESKTRPHTLLHLFAQ